MQTTNKVTCPHCGAAMIQGTAALKTSAVGFALSGFSSQDLWFESAEKKKCIMTSSEVIAAFLCDPCGAISIPRKRSLADKLSEAKDCIAKTIEERGRTKRHNQRR